MPLSVGIVDSGAAPALRRKLLAETRLLLRSDGSIDRAAAGDDVLGHGAQIARIILDLAPAASLVCAQAFSHRRAADAGLVAQGIHWCLDQGVRVINLSFGLHSDVEVLRHASGRAAASGVLLVAAFPARGAPVYPAAYPEAVAVSGDARCDGSSWSVIEPGRLMGACTAAADGKSHGGASYAAARISGFAARFFGAQPNADNRECLAWLQANATFRGRERRTAPRAA
ncbi:MAG: subtilisin-like serine protease QhpE [Burkholderiales bacterium]